MVEKLMVAISVPLFVLTILAVLAIGLFVGSVVVGIGLREVLDSSGTCPLCKEIREEDDEDKEPTTIRK